jgi:phosphate:Na+ symporter
MNIFDVLNMIGGLALFLYGMHIMGDGLSKMAGGKLEGVLEKLTSKRIFAVLLGAGVTAVIQSSSATTVMVVGFVNSGIMKLSQAVGIIMGANIGTTVTSWMLSLTAIEGESILLQLLKPSSFSPVLAAIGIFLVMTKKEESKRRDIGEIMVGFAILMFGMETMSDSVAGLANNASFTGMMTAFSNPILGMIVGTLLTAIIQSSSASVGILQALSATGVVSYAVALPIIMGQNIGTCITSILSSVGATKNAKRAAMIHLYFNLIGTIIFMTAFYLLNMIFGFAFLDTSANAAGIAVLHSLFNITATIILYPFSDRLVHLAEITIRDDKESVSERKSEKVKSVIIDERFLESPAFGVQVCRQKVFEMAEKTKQAITLANGLVFEFDIKQAREIEQLEQRIDEYEDALGAYLIKLSGKNLSKKDSLITAQMLHTISDLERISDHALNVVESMTEMNENGNTFSKDAKREIGVLIRAVNDIVDNTINCFVQMDSDGAKHIEPLEEVIDRLIKKMKAHHVKRLQKGECAIEVGLIFEDILLNLERVSDHCSNIALEILMMGDDNFEIHEFLDDMSAKDKESFEIEYKKLKKIYSLKKENDKIKKKKSKK